MDIAEKRVYDASEGRTRLAVATGQGLAVAGISADVIGEFGLALREPIRAVAAAGDGTLLAATPDDLVLVALGDKEVAETVAVAGIGAGPTTAVTVAGDAVIAAGTDGVVRRAPLSAVGEAIASAGDHSADPAADPAASSGAEPAADPVRNPDGDDAVAWTDLGEATVRAADGRLLAAADGVYRVGEAGIDGVGLDDVRDVAAPEGVEAQGPFAATGEGLFRLGPGWTEERSGAHDLVTAGGQSPTSGSQPPASGGPVAASDDRSLASDDPSAASWEWRAHAGTADGDLLARTDEDWIPVEWPARSPVAGIAYGTEADAAGPDGKPPTFAVAADGTVLADAGDGWRTRSIGLSEVVDCAIVR